MAFDVDSTVCAEEGIDVLADFLGQGAAVAELTAKCVRGVVVVFVVDCVWYVYPVVCVSIQCPHHAHTHCI